MEQLVMASTKKNPLRRGEIHWVDYNYKTQRGGEIKKTRPSLVVSNDVQNELDDQIIVAPLTTEEVEIVRSSFEIFIDKTPENGLEEPSKILCNRLQTVDVVVRLKGFMGIAEPEIISQVNRVLKTVLVLE